MLPALALAAMPEPKGFRDWMAGCDNLRTCAALSVPSDGIDTIAYLRLERPAGPEGAAKLIMRLSGEWQKPPLSVDLKLPAGGKSMPVSTAGDLATVIFQPAEMAAFIEAARKATKLSIAAPGVKAEVSLSGAAAALLWIRVNIVMSIFGNMGNHCMRCRQIICDYFKPIEKTSAIIMSR